SCSLRPRSPLSTASRTLRSSRGYAATILCRLVASLLRPSSSTPTIGTPTFTPVWRSRGGLAPMAVRIVMRRVLCVSLLAVVLAPFLMMPVLRRLFPIPFAREIAATAQENALDPFLLAALVRVESGFNPRAVSSRGARCLMQVMPDTGQWIASQMGWSAFDPD